MGSRVWKTEESQPTPEKLSKNNVKRNEVKTTSQASNKAIINGNEPNLKTHQIQKKELNKIKEKVIGR